MNTNAFRARWALAVGLSIGLLGASAEAAPLQFTLSDAAGGTASWVMDSQPVPDWQSSQAFRVYGIQVTYVKQNTVTRRQAVQFGNAIVGGGAGLGTGPSGGFAIVKTTGPQMYSGSESAPTIIPGTYTLTSVLARTLGQVYTLTISPAP